MIIVYDSVISPDTDILGKLFDDPAVRSKLIKSHVLQDPVDIVSEAGEQSEQWRFEVRNSSVRTIS